MQGVDAEPVDAKHVAESLMPFTITSVEVKARISAIPPGTGKELMSTTRNRNRVIGAPVLFTNRRRTERVPLAPLVTGVKLRIRFGLPPAGAVESINSPGIVEFRGEPRFSGPGAPNLWPAGVLVASVSANRKSVALLFLSTGN